MSVLSDKTTIYLDPRVKKFIQFKAVNENRSVSEIVNSKFAEALEDLQDLSEVKKRAKEPTIPFEKVLNDYGLTLDDIQN